MSLMPRSQHCLGLLMSLTRACSHWATVSRRSVEESANFNRQDVKIPQLVLKSEQF
jgi:hypothetical protein